MKFIVFQFRICVENRGVQPSYIGSKQHRGLSNFLDSHADLYCCCCLHSTLKVFYDVAQYHSVSDRNEKSLIRIHVREWKKFNISKGMRQRYQHLKTCVSYVPIT